MQKFSKTIFLLNANAPFYNKVIIVSANPISYIFKILGVVLSKAFNTL